VPTIRPSAHTVSVADGGVCDDPANAYDGNVATMAKLKTAVDGAFVEEIMESFGDDGLTERSDATLRINLRAVAWQNGEAVYLYMRNNGGASWTQIAHYTAGDIDDLAPEWKEIDVTAICGAGASTGMEFAAQMVRDYGGEPPPPSGA